MKRLGIIGGLGPESTVAYYRAAIAAAALLAVIDRLVSRARVQAIALAGTELPLLLPQGTESPVPLLDTGEIHAAAAARRLSQEPVQ
jgi:aspartate/glutamate racemase